MVKKNYWNFNKLFSFILLYLRSWLGILKYIDLINL